MWNFIRWPKMKLYPRTCWKYYILIYKVVIIITSNYERFQVTVFSRFCYVLLCNHEYIHCLNHRQAKDYITRRNKTERKLSFERRLCIRENEYKVVIRVTVYQRLLYMLYSWKFRYKAHHSGGHSHMEVTGMCGQDPQSRGLSVTD